MELIIKKRSPFRKLGRRIKDSSILMLMSVPAIIYYAIFCYAPMYGIVIAFKYYYPKKGIIGSPWNGFENFKIIFENSEFWQVLRNTIFIGLGKIIISFVAAILVALLINEIRMRRFKKGVQVIATFPHFLSWVIVGGLIINIFGRAGTINDIIALCGGERIEFMSSPNFFLAIIFLSDIWKEAGWSSIIYLATIAGIAPELYEAAEMDGCSRIGKIWHITLPGIKATAVLLLILSVGGVLSAGFDQIFNLYNPLVYNVSDILDTYIYRTTFRVGTNAGQGAAIGLFKSVVSFILVILVDRIAKLCGERGVI